MTPYSVPMSSYSEFEILFRQLYRPLCLYAMHYLGDLDMAEDAVCGSFGTLWEKSGKIGNPRAWLYASVRNAAMDALRRAGKESPLPRDLDGIISDEDARDRSIEEARLWTAIDNLPRRRRQIFLMAKRDGMSYADIALSLGISESTVRNSMEAALKSLRSRRREILGFILCL